MIGKGTWLRKEVLKRRAFDFFELTRTAKPWIEVIFEERTKINFFERIFFVRSGGWCLFRGGSTFTLLLAAADVVDERNGIFKFLEHRILNHLGSDHVLQLKLVQSEDADHLHEARSEDLPLRDF